MALGRYKKFQIQLYPVYSAEIEKYWKYKEQCRMRYTCQSPQLKLRSDLISWLKNVSVKLNLSNITLHLAVYMVDFFMDNHSITLDRLGLVALVCLMLAAKFEELEEKVPKISELNLYDGHRYPKTDFVLLEFMILRFFNWSLMQPTVAHFAEYYVMKAVSEEDLNPITSYQYLYVTAYKILYDFLHVALLETSLLHYRPSRVAASCILATRRTLHLQPSWSRSLAVHTGYEENSLEDCCTIIVTGSRQKGPRKLKRKLDSPDDGYSSNSDTPNTSFAN